MSYPEIMTPRGRVDQAEGLRRLFATARPVFLAVASNPLAQCSDVLLERLTCALSLLGRRCVLVDAGEDAPVPHELAPVDLASCVERLSPQVGYLAARGLPLRFVDARGQCDQFLKQLEVSVPAAQVFVVHAPAAELARLFCAQSVRPIVMASDHPISVTEAYAAMKLMHQRCGAMAFDLLLAAPAQSPRQERIVEQLGRCADQFLGAALSDSACLDPLADPQDHPGVDLVRIIRDQLSRDTVLTALPDIHHHGPPRAPGARFAAAVWT